MPKIKYRDVNFNDVSVELIQKALVIIDRYSGMGYGLTTRQLYYQFVAGDIFPDKWKDPATGSTNNEKSYKKLGNIIADARLAGLIDWNSIEDRTREVDGNSHWNSPSDIISSAAYSFKLDKWADQPNRIEIWVEKDALEGVVGKAAKALDIQFFSCRGYASATSIWDAGQRLKKYALQKQQPIILHLGDHDPSGIDMSRDVEERLKLFMDHKGYMLRFERIALNMDQVEEYSPPPNPAKVTDSRFAKYRDEHGEDCWELDALDPAVIEELITNRVAELRDDDLFDLQQDNEDIHKSNLGKAATHWDSKVAPFVSTLK